MLDPDVRRVVDGALIAHLATVDPLGDYAFDAMLAGDIEQHLPWAR
jgi:hypothetical protein